MIAHRALHLAVRAHVRTLVVATTGTTTLEATSTGYARATGSFLADGFLVGMPVTPSGFTQTAQGIITAVDALTMTIDGGRTVQTSGSGRSLVSGLPSLVAYENVASVPTANVPYVEEEYLPGGANAITIGSGGTLRVTPTYVLRCHGRVNVGIGALRAQTDALLAHCKPGTSWLVDGHTLRVRHDVAPFPSPLTVTDDGWAVVTLSVPLEYHAPNT